ncbi:MAG: Na+/H+ antiporter NhaA, partial [Pseudomonadota bacterium]|nr:Na+/H+ antiporter NhaA [Pseudomonadota bacterium]
MTATTSTVQQQEKRAGLLLVGAAAAALLLANFGWADGYHHLLETRVGPPMPRLGAMTLHEWVADGLMAIFFLLVGLEVKREWLVGR